MPKENKDKELPEVDELSASVPEVEPAEVTVDEVESEVPAEEALNQKPDDGVSVFAADEVTEEATSDDSVTIQQVKFASFEDLGQAQGEINKNLDILMDIKLQLTVELGRTELPIKKVLELTRGSIVELEKVAGEPVELYANGKLVAHGEVVVIEDNFGLRITSITESEDRLKGL